MFELILLIESIINLIFFLFKKLLEGKHKELATNEFAFSILNI